MTDVRSGKRTAPHHRLGSILTQTERERQTGRGACQADSYFIVGKQTEKFKQTDVGGVSDESSAVADADFA
jgi:hypothetical protein